MENNQLSGRKRVSIVGAWKESPRSHQVMMGVMPAFFVLTAIAFLVTWAIHDIPLMPTYGITLILALVIWHSVTVKGKRQTIAFFVICPLLCWFCEFIGHNYGWFFGGYHYTDTLGQRIGGVPVLVVITWPVMIYAAFMIVDWLVGMKGAKRVRSWWGNVIWSGLIAAASATLVCAWDLMMDPFATSAVWRLAADRDPPWYWIDGGPYLRELPAGLGNDGVPIGNFVGWWLAAFAAVFIFYLFFQKRDLISGKLVNTVPLLVYASVYFSMVIVVLEMNWFVDGMNQVALIGTFTMMPVILLCAVKLVWDYT